MTSNIVCIHVLQMLRLRLNVRLSHCAMEIFRWAVCPDLLSVDYV